ncbi:MAG: hypothetical protein LBO06_06310 [Bacteroidales bacterium]|jgi:hypothetical protein|nr:hypothetical protein [Bacteroidales bacterium]
MKKVFTFVAIMTVATLGFSQSKFFFGGDLSFGSNSASTTQTAGGQSQTFDIPASTNFGIDLSANYLVTKNFAVGLGIGYGTQKDFAGFGGLNNDVELYNKQGVFSIIPQVHYFCPLSDNFSYAPGLYIALGFGSADYESYNIVPPAGIVTATADIFAFGVELRPLSFDFKPTDHIAINFSAGSLSYTTVKVTEEPVTGMEIVTKQNSFNLDLNLGFTLGFRYFL